VILFS